ncbi:Contactin-3 [Labeo rohita]|uniref:Contactin-3 n=1 Tax=Labeo rohita TaxID=84645 RepID=A0ABQ8L9J9_LABRO|nr:Contactin-3 [Labeo rohita]
MADKCHLCLLGLIILSSLLTGTSGVDDAHVFISSGENVRLPCNNHLHDCKSTTWNYNSHSAAVELINSGEKKKNTERHERLSLGSDCSLNIKNITKEDYGLYTCRQYVNEQQQGTDDYVFLHVLHVSSSSSQTEISAGSSVTLYCQLYSYPYSYSHSTLSCDDWIHSEGIQLFWVNQAGVKLTISDTRYQMSASRLCIGTVTTTLLNEDDNREWRCEVTHRNQVKTSVTYTVKSSDPAQTEDSWIAESIFRVIVIIVEFAVFAAPTVILLQIICARRAERKNLQHQDEIVMNTSHLVNGEVTMGVRPPLPVEGVDVILGNNLAASQYQSVPSPDGVSAPRDDLYSPECQQRPHRLDETQRQIPSEDLVT